MRYLIVLTAMLISGCADANEADAPLGDEETATQEKGSRREPEQGEITRLRQRIDALESDLSARSEVIDRCASISRQLDRLDCFDGISGSDTEEAEESEAGSGNWIVNVDSNPIDDTRRVTAFLISDQGRSSFGEPVTFIARCMSNRTEAYINWNDYVGDDSTSVYSEWKRVTVRVGERQAQTERWGVSTDKRATFAPAWAGNLLREMMEADRVVFRTTPYGENPVVAIFDTSGMAAALRPLMETCGWAQE